MKKLPILYKRKIIYVNFEITKNKNMYIKIHEGQILVTAPKYFSEENVINFVTKHIDDFMNKINANSKEYFSFEKNFIYLKGKKYKMNVLTGFNNHSFKIIKNNFYLHLSGDIFNYDFANILNSLLKNELNKYILKRILYFEKLMNLKNHSFKIKNNHSKWGSNKIGTSELTFSTNLIHYSAEVIDYVIVHELSHSIEPNHSSLFWKVVSEIVPNWKKIRDTLNKGY